MNDTEAANVFAVLKAAWPDKQLPPETIDLWLELAADLHYTDAKQAALQIVREDHWFPSIARFRQVAEVHAHRRRNAAAASRGLPANRRAVPPPEPLLAAARQLIEEQKAKPHNHHGPEPCPACGHLPPRTRLGQAPPGKPA